jgi:hypothetical protein
MDTCVVIFSPSVSSGLKTVDFQDMIPVLERIQQALDIKSQLDGAVDKGNYSTVSFPQISYQ